MDSTCSIPGWVFSIHRCDNPPSSIPDESQLSDFISAFRKHFPILRVVYCDCLYKEEHFKEVDTIYASGATKKDALDKVAQKYGFNYVSFRQQYYVRNPKKKGRRKPRK